MTFSHAKLVDEMIIVGRGHTAENIGRIDPLRIHELYRGLRQLNLLPPDLDVSSTFSTHSSNHDVILSPLLVFLICLEK